MPTFYGICLISYCQRTTNNVVIFLNQLADNWGGLVKSTVYVSAHKPHAMHDMIGFAYPFLPATLLLQYVEIRNMKINTDNY